MNTTRRFTIVLCTLGTFSALIVQAVPPTAFSYQGQLKHDGIPVNGEARFSFSLWDALQDGNQVGLTVGARLEIINGLFTAPLDFGAEAFNGEPRWLEISVSTPQGEGMLTPRQPITPAPMALFALDGNPGPRGPSGINGLACWDLDGDGIQDREEDINNDGALDTLDCQGNGGSVELTLPYAGTNTTDETAMAITNVGLGGTASFSTLNSNSTDVVVGVLNTGTGPGVMAVSNGGGPAIVGATGTAGGSAGQFSVVGNIATQAALKASNNALGSAAHFETTNTENTNPTLYVETLSDSTVIHAHTGGMGRAGLFEVDNIGFRTVPAMEAVSNGRNGGAGLFRTTSILNSSAALIAESVGNANAIQGTAAGSGAGVMGYNAFGGNAVVGLVEGNAGKAGSFRSTDDTNPNPTLEAVRSGSGSAGRFENTTSGGLAGEFVGDVTVAGTVNADSFKYRTPHVYHLSLNAFDFAPNNRGFEWYREDGQSGTGVRIHSDNGRRGYLGAPVHLPHGARVTGIKVYYSVDASWLDLLEVGLYRRLMWNGNDSPMATMVSPAYTNNGEFDMANYSISFPVINNESYSYWVFVGPDGICANDQTGCDHPPVKGVMISYTKDID